MPRSARLRATDVRAVYRLAGECRDLGDDAAVWWKHFGRRLAGLIGADFAGCGQVVGPLREGATTRGVAEWGWENGFDKEPWDRSVELHDTDPEYLGLYLLYFDRLAADPGTCLARTDLMADRDWVRSGLFREVSEPMGVDHYLWCYAPTAGVADGYAVATLDRAAGRADFTAREKAVVREANALIAPLVGGALAGFADPSPSGLPPRARQVLKCLLEGDSDKQAAARLRISVHTVNQYAKAVYRHFGATTRAELLARWVKRGWSARCAWAEE